MAVIMEMAEYQRLASKTASFPKDSQEFRLAILGLGLAGETGETVDKVKKLINNDSCILTDEKKVLIVSELGDVLWYLSQLAAEIGSSLDEVAQKNIQKLADRARRGLVVSGVGDTR